jgi:LysM repeat protein/5-hydroxyisourate hydrolase-like protein (transthyretin family)
LWGIAAAHNVRLGELAAANGLSPDARLRIGDVLCLDGLVEAQPMPDQTSGSTLPPGGNSFGTGGPNQQTPVTPQVIQSGQGGQAATTQNVSGQAGGGGQSAGNAQSANRRFIRGQNAANLPQGWRVHDVVKGDTLFSLARTYKVGVANIIQANNIVYPQLIYIGESLIIPPEGSGTPPPGGGSGTGQPGTGGPTVHRPAPGTIPVITLPATAAPGATITVVGSNYPGNTEVALFFEKPSYGLRSDRIKTVTTNPDGTFSTTIILPNTTIMGGYNFDRSTISVSGYARGGYWAMNYFLLVSSTQPPPIGGGTPPGSGSGTAVHRPAPGTIPVIALPAIAKPGQTITVNGSNYPGNAPVDLYFEKPYLGLKTDKIQTVTTNADGTFTTTLTLPNTTVMGGYNFDQSTVSVSGYSTGGYWAMNYFFFTSK